MNAREAELKKGCGYPFDMGLICGEDGLCGSCEGRLSELRRRMAEEKKIIVEDMLLTYEQRTQLLTALGLGDKE